MSEPFVSPSPPPRREGHTPRPRTGAAVAASLAVVAGTVLLSVAAGYGWAALAPRPLLVMTGRGAAALVNAETNALIAADGTFCLVCLAGGVVSGVLGYVFAVRRHGPPAMAAVVLGAVAAAFVTRWIGEQSGLATFHHLLATLPAGRRLRGSVTLGAGSGLAFWPLAASLMAGGLALRTGRQAGRGAHAGRQTPPAP